MAGRVAQCPNCGSQVHFRAGSSLLTVCEYCSSTVARVGEDVGELEITGKVAPLAATGSTLFVGAEGAANGASFVLLGRLQLDYGAGPWDEWYASFGGWPMGMVAEAASRIWITFQSSEPPPIAYDAAVLGSEVYIANRRFVVVERRKGVLRSAEGELPFPIVPGSSTYYCDLSGPGRSAATLDFGPAPDAAPTVYVGESFERAEVFEASVSREGRESERADAAGINCPNCGAGFELRVPDQSLRVTCPRCESLLDCSKGSSSFAAERSTTGRRARVAARKLGTAPGSPIRGARSARAERRGR
ncbi:MAG: DUF4178 domain-containing protein [Myxococcales bacterium]|nr:DUF4178 domain-containing protein [Myxococcales bacterium]